MTGGKPLVVNGWTLFAHPIFLDQLEALTTQVEALKHKDPAGYARKNASKRLAAFNESDEVVVARWTNTPRRRTSRGR